MPVARRCTSCADTGYLVRAPPTAISIPRPLSMPHHTLINLTRAQSSAANRHVHPPPNSCHTLINLTRAQSSATHRPTTFPPPSPMPTGHRRQPGGALSDAVSSRPRRCHSALLGYHRPSVAGRRSNCTVSTNGGPFTMGLNPASGDTCQSNRSEKTESERGRGRGIEREGGGAITHLRMRTRLVA